MTSINQLSTHVSQTILSICLLWAAPLSVQAKEDAFRPNILLFIVDDMGRHETSLQIGDIHSKWNDLYRTPAMEKLADRGRVFTSAYASGPVCTASRVSIMLGQAPVRHGTTFITGRRGYDTKTMRSADQDNLGIHGEELNRTLPRILTKNGYRTITVGKAHFGPNDPTLIGFDVNRYGTKSGSPIGNGRHRFMQKVEADGNRTEIHLSEALTIAAKEEIDHAIATKEPFFMYMSHYAVHTPIISDERFADSYRDRKDLNADAKAFATLVEGMDKSLNDLITHLEEKDIAQNTLILFTTDQGGLTYHKKNSLYENDARYEHGRTSNWPLRGGKNDVYEGGLRIPSIISWAKPSPSDSIQKRLPIEVGSIESRPFIHADILPTLLTVLGLKDQIPSAVDGKDFSGYITGDQTFTREDKFFWHAPNFWMRGKAKPESAYRKDGYKLVCRYHEQGVSWELYDLRKDIQEKNNLIQAMPERAQAMARELISYLASENANYPVLIKTGEQIKPTLPK